jgi:DGQHR domain-containing protein
MKTLTIPAIEIKQNGTRLLLTKIRAGDLINYTRIDPYDSSKDFADATQGYQRPPELTRIKKFANWLKQEVESGRVRMPTAILLSARGSDIVIAQNGTLTLKESNKLPLVDGQHRMRGFQYAIEEKGLTQFADYEVPVVILMDVDIVAEMRQFNIVNGTQKSVRTDLVNMILTQLAEREGVESVKESEHWKIIVSRVVTQLNEDQDGPWYDQIVMPDASSYSKEQIAEDESLRHKRVARATSFMTSLKPIEAYLTEHHLSAETLDQRAETLVQVVSEFWKAIQEMMPECFEKADDYVLQKTPGIFTLHKLCREIMRDMWVGRRPWEKEHFKEMLSSCEELSNPAFWAVGTDEGNRGDGARYGSMKGFSELADLLYKSMRS